ncbi:Uncharacterized protein ALO59_04315 [Pseudomonas amygdali pv. mellea]|uniref:hypothetical protein n=1 Tax=Pseudomonas amygdali TaxID=47877 RepID=UPI0006E650A4|nr:hypothetical protein [Pseudomonas amygdali]KPW28152.1 Uncharacterized protein ALO51_03459 [Pseudomonas amygdali]KPX83041.1 Uncharacterized protein ALO59_04315 [Pseudomonas amygdali pv. mellea]
MYLLDSDAARKLCQYELIEELIVLLGCTIGDVAVLPQLKFQLRLTNDVKALEKLGTANAVDLAKRLIASAQEVEVSATSANPLLELNRPDIDTGEATLFAALCERSDSSLVSGDKRAFIALSRVNGIPAIDGLWARMLCLEEALLWLARDGDFPTVSEKVRNRLDVDTSIGISFGRSAPAAQQTVIYALQSYIDHLTQQTSGKYAPQ